MNPRRPPPQQKLGLSQSDSSSLRPFLPTPLPLGGGRAWGPRAHFSTFTFSSPLPSTSDTGSSPGRCDGSARRGDGPQNNKQTSARGPTTLFPSRPRVTNASHGDPDSRGRRLTDCASEPITGQSGAAGARVANQSRGGAPGGGVGGAASPGSSREAWRVPRSSPRRRSVRFPSAA